jgi:hypothetical protein
MFSIRSASGWHSVAQKRVSDNDSSKHCRDASGKQAFRRPPGEMFHREIDSIRQPEKRDDRGHVMKALPQLIAQAIGRGGALRGHD